MMIMGIAIMIMDTTTKVMRIITIITTLMITSMIMRITTITAMSITDQSAIERVAGLLCADLISGE
jgi:hypothetical protein